MSLSAIAHGILANLGYYADDPGGAAFAACYLGAGTPPAAWVRRAVNGWHVAVSKAVVPRLAADSAWASTVDSDERPQDAAFVVAVQDKDELYGVFELIASASTPLPRRPAPRPPADDLPPALGQAVDAVLISAEGLEWSKETVVKALRDVRVGQGDFRQALLDQWGGACAVTSLRLPALLRASHCKPWSQSDAHERLDRFNGLLLAAHLDAAFDGGYISFDTEGCILISPRLGPAERAALHLHEAMRLRSISHEHQPYLAWHRQHAFKAGP